MIEERRTVKCGSQSSRGCRGDVKIADDGQRREGWARDEGFISCHLPCAPIQYGSFQVYSARCLVGPAAAWVLFGLERVGKTLGSSGDAAGFSSWSTAPKSRFVGCNVLVNGDPSVVRSPRNTPVDGRCTGDFGLEQLAIQPLQRPDLARQEEAVSVHAAFFFLQGDCRALTPQRVRSKMLCRTSPRA